jgi:hypothetical protein
MLCVVYFYISNQWTKDRLLKFLAITMNKVIEKKKTSGELLRYQTNPHIATLHSGEKLSLFFLSKTSCEKTKQKLSPYW